MSWRWALSQDGWCSSNICFLKLGSLPVTSSPLSPHCEHSRSWTEDDEHTQSECCVSIEMKEAYTLLPVRFWTSDVASVFFLCNRSQSLLEPVLGSTDIPVCSYLCLNSELLFWNILSHRSHAYIPFSVFRVFFLGGVESESFWSSTVETPSELVSCLSS